MVVLDTNIIIDHLRRPGNHSLLKKISTKISKNDLALSVISVQELYEGQSTKEKQAETLLLATIAPLKILPYTFKTAKLAGKINRDLRQPIALADAAIAASTIEQGAELLTLNNKHFKQIEGLQLFNHAEL